MRLLNLYLSFTGPSRLHISALTWARVFSVITVNFTFRTVHSHSIVSSPSPTLFYAPLFLLMFLRCVGTLNFNGLLMFGCKLQSAKAWSGLVFLPLLLLFVFSSSCAIRQSTAQSGSALSLLAPTATWWWDSQHDWVNIIKEKLSLEIAAARFKQAGMTPPKESSTAKFG